MMHTAYMCAVALHRLSHLSFCSSGFPQAKSTHNALLLCRCIQALWNHFLSLTFYFFSYSIIQKIFLFLLQFCFLFLCRCDSSTDIKGPHLLTGDVTLIIKARQNVPQCNVLHIGPCHICCKGLLCVAYYYSLYLTLTCSFMTFVLFN